MNLDELFSGYYNITNNNRKWHSLVQLFYLLRKKHAFFSDVSIIMLIVKRKKTGFLQLQKRKNFQLKICTNQFKCLLQEVRNKISVLRYLFVSNFLLIYWHFPICTVASSNFEQYEEPNWSFVHFYYTIYCCS